MSEYTDDTIASLPEAGGTFLLYPYLKGEQGLDPDARLEETDGLAEAIGLDVVGYATAPLPKINASTFIGKGRISDLKQQYDALGVKLVIMDCALSPIQQRNLEKAWDLKVIDRTGLILEIFGERAQTREGVLQVELAHLEYQKTRLVRAWTHLERQRGGFGFMGGPGERQIESDRRALRDRIAAIKLQLDKVSRTRGLHRKSRGAVPYPIVALVGYTNAGKSTLFNRMTGADVVARDRLFETLDPTMRAIELESGRKVIMSDTVGFISQLPHELIAAFRATLEEVLEADLILHVRDAANPDTERQKRDVMAVLANLGVDADTSPMIEVMNKADQLDQNQRDQLTGQAERRGDMVLISALTGEGCDRLEASLEKFMSAADTEYGYRLPYSAGEATNWLYQNAKVTGREDLDDGSILRVQMNTRLKGKFEKMFRVFPIS